MIIDFHSHAFPDQIATKAIPALEQAGKITAHTTGTTQSLVASMDRAGIDRSLICSIATRPEQFQAILDWSRSIRTKRLIPLPSIHPDDPRCVEHVHIVHQEGFAGIKMHPYYQNFSLNEKRLNPLYHALSDTGLLFVVHCGFDIAYPRERLADPAQILSLHRRFPRLRLIATHFGSWELWDEVEEILIGKNIYMEISFALQYLKEEQMLRMLNNHSPQYLLFGTDSPWTDQAECLKKLRSLPLQKKLLTAILGDNAMRLL